MRGGELIKTGNLAKQRPIDFQLAHPRPQCVRIDREQPCCSARALHTALRDMQRRFNVGPHCVVQRRDSAGMRGQDSSAPGGEISRSIERTARRRHA